MTTESSESMSVIPTVNSNCRNQMYVSLSGAPVIEERREAGALTGRMTISPGLICSPFGPRLAIAEMARSAIDDAVSKPAREGIGRE